MRNVENVEAPRIFRTEEVHFDFRPYYRIEVTNGSDAPDDVVAPPLEPEFGSSGDTVPEVAELGAEEVVGWPDESDEGVAESTGETADVVTEDPETVASAEASADDHVEPAEDDDAGDDPVEVTEVADSVISPRRGLFGR